MSDLGTLFNDGTLGGAFNSTLSTIGSVMAERYRQDANKAGYEANATLAANSMRINTEQRQTTMLYLGIGALLVLGAIVAIKVR